MHSSPLYTYKNNTTTAATVTRNHQTLGRPTLLRLIGTERAERGLGGWWRPLLPTARACIVHSRDTEDDDDSKAQTFRGSTQYRRVGEGKVEPHSVRKSTVGHRLRCSPVEKVWMNHAIPPRHVSLAPPPTRFFEWYPDPELCAHL